MAIYSRPELPIGTKVQSLVAEGLHGQQLTPKTRVLVVNRGTADYCEKFDGRNYVVPGGKVSEVEYEVADYLRDRSVIPGSRDPMTGKSEHFIAILGIDPAERCELLDKDEQHKADTTVEAIDRSLMDGADRDVKVVSTQAARARTVGGTRRIAQRVEGNDGSPAPEDAMTPPVMGEARRGMAQDTWGKAREEK